jgi:membrane dipeptidase
MHRRSTHTALLGAVAFAAACASSGSNQTVTQAGADVIARARAIHERAITIDTHDDIPGNFATPEVDPLNYPRQVNLEKMKAGGLDVAFFAVYVGQGPRTPEGNERAKEQALQKFAAIHRLAEQMYPARIAIAYTPDDVRRIVASGKLVAAIGIENGWVIGNDLSLIKRYHDLGGRYMTLAHTSNNDICDSSTDPRGPEHHGLSAFGRQVVAEMNRVGMMVDVSHVSRECMMQATALSTLPVIASHSSTTAEAPVPRNLDDEQLRAIARNGGVAQMVALAGYVRAESPERQAAVRALRQEMGPALGFGRGRGRNAAPMSREDSLRADSVRAVYQAKLAEIDRKYPYPRPTVKDFVDHIDHAVKVAGIDHVGISSDFDGGGGIEGWNDASESLNVTVELVRRGYTEEQIRKLWGENTLRVWQANTRAVP